MALKCTSWMIGIAVLSSVALASGANDSGRFVEENFENCSAGSGVWFGEWSTDWMAVMNSVEEGPIGKMIAVKAINGVNSRIQFEAQESGVFKCSFDWLPGNGQTTFFGFKVPDSTWDQYQAAVYFEPVGGNIYTMRGKERVKISTKPLRLGDATSVAVYHVVLIVQPRAADKKPGNFQVIVTGQEGVIAKTDRLPFSANVDKPISLFEIRSIRWNEPKDAINGYFDNLVIENDPETIPFTLNVACEKWGHVYFRGKPIQLLGRIRNLRDKNVQVPVILTVTDYYGKEVFRKSRMVTVNAQETAVVEESLEPKLIDRYGVYRVKFGGGPDGARLFANTTFVVIGPPNMDTDSFNSHFGVFQYPLSSEKGFLEKIVEQMHDIGVKWLRINCHWNNHESAKGKFDWDGGGVPMGTFIDLAYKHDMHVMVELAYTAKWASSMPNDERGGAIDTGTFWESVAPKDFADWENYCRKAAERFKGKVTYYEIWNEPGAPVNYKDFNGFWRDSSENFVKIIKYASKGIKSVDPNAKICVGGFRVVDIGSHFDNFVERVLPEAIDSIDVISFHCAGVGYFTPKYYDFKILMKHLGRENMVYFDTESPGLAQQDTTLVRGYLESWANGVAKNFGFIYNLPRYDHASLVHADYTPDIGTVAFSTMTRFLEGAEMEGWIPAPGVHAYSLLKNNQRIIVAWSAVADKEVDARIYGADHTFDFQGNPGPKVTPGEYGLNHVMVGNDPVYIFCKLDLDLKRASRVKK